MIVLWFVGTGVCAQTTNAAVVEIKETGKREIMNHDFEHALIDLDRYCKTDWTDPEGHFWLGYALAGTGRTMDALHAYDAAEQKQANFGMDCAELRVNRGNLLFKFGKIAEAQTEYQRALEIDPTVLDARLDLAQVLLLQDRVDEAFTQLGHCSNSRADDPKFCFLEGIANLKKGQVDSSIFWLQKCQVTSNQSQYGSRYVDPVAVEGQKLLQYLRSAH